MKAHPRRILITDEKVEMIRPREKRFEYWDKEITGLGLRVSPSGRKTWVVLRRHGKKKTLRRVTIGTYPMVKTKFARTIATEIEIKRLIDIHEKIRSKV